MLLEYSKDISIAWTSFLLKIVGLWLAADEYEQRRRNYALYYTIGTIFIATCIAIRDIYFSWGNFSDCVFVTCNILYLMVVFCKIAVLLAHRSKFYSLIKFTQKNFWHTNYDSEEKIILANCRATCSIFIIVISFCVQGTCAGYMVTPLLANIGRNQSARILPFNMWVDFPTGLSPYFEISFTIQMLCVYHVGICYICFDNFLCLLNLHAASQFRILQYRLLNLDREIKKEIGCLEVDNIISTYAMAYQTKLKNCVRFHQMLTEYCKVLENIFSLLAMSNVLFVAMVLCFVGCQLFLIEIPPSRSVSLVLNFIGALFQLLIFTYSCDGLVRESTKVGEVIFFTPWVNIPMNAVGKSLRQIVIIITMRSNRHCCLTAGGFFLVSLQTYTGVLSSAMSYFTLLRQSSQKLMNM